MVGAIFPRVLLLVHERPFARYLLVGGSTFAIDFALLVCLHSALRVNLAIATTTGYWVSVIYNFFMNRHWVFNAQQVKSLKAHASLYSCLLAINYVATVGTVSILTKYVPYEVAKALIVVVSISWMYPIQKTLIFHPGRRIATAQLASDESRL